MNLTNSILKCNAVFLAKGNCLMFGTTQPKTNSILKVNAVLSTKYNCLMLDSTQSNVFCIKMCCINFLYLMSVLVFNLIIICFIQ